MTNMKKAICIAAGLVLSANLSQATLLFYEPFDYTSGASLTGQTGGTGFGSAYTTNAGSSMAIQSGSLTYTDGLGNSLAVSGNKMQATQANDLRTFSTPITGITTLYVSMIAQGTTGTGGGTFQNLQLQNFNGTTTQDLYALGRDSNNSIWEGVFGNPNGSAANSAVSVATQSFLVMKVEIGVTGGTQDRISLWVNPDLTAVEGTPTATTTVAINAQWDMNATQLRIGTGGTAGASMTYDELRGGTAWNDVVVVAAVPEPSVAALTCLGLFGLIRLVRRKATN